MLKSEIEGCKAMNASLATADRGTYLKTILVACLFSLVALGVAANMTAQGLGKANRPDGMQIATRGSAERATFIATAAFAARTLPGNPM